MSASSERTPLFLLGVGFIGGSLLQGLLKSEKYEITALCRDETKANVLRELGVKPLMGTLSSDEMIVAASLANDIIIHTATADDEPSVKSILKALRLRPASSTPAVYLHTSGTALFADGGESIVAGKHVYSDKKPEEIDALPDSAPHRNVDLLIKNAVEKREVGNAMVAIIIPPMIHGVGNGPFNKTSIDVPQWIRQSIKSGQVDVIGAGVALTSSIHITNLVSAYETIIEELVTSAEHPSPSSPFYFFSETHTQSWVSIARAIHTALRSRGLIKSDGVVLGNKSGYWGINSRSSADRLREIGWKGDEDSTSMMDSVEFELEVVLQEKAGTSVNIVQIAQ